MEIREIMTRDPEMCTAEQSCAEAGAVMRRRRCGFVPIVDSPSNRRVVGVVTDRDIALCLTATHRPANEVELARCMTDHAVTIAPDAELEEAARLMETAAIHRLPVVDEGRLVGVLSLKDIALCAQVEWKNAGPHRVEQQLADIIEAIAAARVGQVSGVCGK